MKAKKWIGRDEAREKSSINPKGMTRRYSALEVLFRPLQDEDKTITVGLERELNVTTKPGYPVKEEKTDRKRFEKKGDSPIPLKDSETVSLGDEASRYTEMPPIDFIS